MTDPGLLDRARQAEELGFSLLGHAAELRRQAGSSASLAPPAPAPHPRLVGAVRSLREIRARRSQHLDPALFGEPAWDILLALFEAHLAQRETPVDSLSSVASPYPATAERWLRILIRQRLVEVAREAAPGQPARVQLTHAGIVAMTLATLGLGDAP